jgi:hypothetical protein
LWADGILMPHLPKALPVSGQWQRQTDHLTMTKEKIKYLLDFLPLLILTVYTIVLIWTIATTNIIFSYEHYLGLTLFVFTAALFIVRHKLGVLLLGLTLILGLFKVLSFSATITFSSYGASINGHSSPEIKIQAFYPLWVIIHFIVSGRHYIGILTEKYWLKLFAKSSTKTSG